jgi:putative tricarboxylic transport membrane protein
MHHGMIALLAAAAGVAPASVSYAGTGGVAEAVAALAAGQVTVAALGATDVLAALRAGTVRLLAILADRRLPGPLAGVPTAREQGVDVVFPMWRGFYAPPGISEAVVAFWGEVFARMVRTPAWARVLDETGWFPFLLTGAQFRAFLDDDTRRYAAALPARRGAEGVGGGVV